MTSSDFAARVQPWLPDGEICLQAVPASVIQSQWERRSRFKPQVIAVTNQSIVVLECEAFQPGYELTVVNRQRLGTRIQRVNLRGRVNVGSYPLWVRREFTSQLEAADRLSVELGA